MQKPPAIQKCDGRTDVRTDGPTDTARCRVACPRLKTDGKRLIDFFNLYCQFVDKRIDIKRPGFRTRYRWISLMLASVDIDGFIVYK